MQLVNPTTFECPTHHVDLTPQVIVALEELPPPISYGDERFRVPVTCPGDGSAHPLTCAGTYTP